MTDLERRFHEQWLGMVQPSEGLVVSLPVLVDAQCMERHGAELVAKLRALAPAVPGADADPSAPPRRRIESLARLFAELLALEPSRFDGELAGCAQAMPPDVRVLLPEGPQEVVPTLALRRDPPADAHALPSERYVALVWDLSRYASPSGQPLELDAPEAVTGAFRYPPAQKFDRLLRHLRVPIGLLSNGSEIRLVYAPSGAASEASGHLAFRIDDLAASGGQPILDAFVMLLHEKRLFGVAEQHSLPALLAESRKRQAAVTNTLAEQVFDALAILLRGFEAAAERDGAEQLRQALEREGDHVYQGLLTVLLRLVFLLYAEDRSLLPVEHPLYAEHLSLLALYQDLEDDAGLYPDSMSRRFGAYGRLVALFRAVYLGVHHGELAMPERRGSLFDPHRFPFLEGWGPAGAAPIKLDEDRARVRLPTIDDATVHQVLQKLLLLDGQRLSYRSLEVEQIGSVYEALMGYHVERCEGPAVCLRPLGVWVSPAELVALPKAQRARHLQDRAGLSKAQAEKLAEAFSSATGAEAQLEALASFARGSTQAARQASRARPGQLVLQPGAERRRTSSHYTPQSLSAPIVRRTLEPLLACMGPEAASERLLELKICDPAMGSGAFLVEACRALGEEVARAWQREGIAAELSARGKSPELEARRQVAQRCLYGVDKNAAAVELAKLSLWLLTLAKDAPFSFLDHALRHGDSLVGLDFDQIRAFHWRPSGQLHLSSQILDQALGEAVAIRQAILSLASDDSPEAQRERARLSADAADACELARLAGDLVIGAFFSAESDKARDKERVRRLDLFTRYASGERELEQELRAMQQEIRARIPVFHWMLELSEVFHAERPDPLDDARVNRAAKMDAFVGNPPFAGKNNLADANGPGYVEWLQAVHEGAHGNADLSAHFFRRAASLLGDHGAIGLIATNTIAQGDTRATGLQHLVGEGFVIYDATRSMPWPGDAAVSVAVVHLAKGQPTKHVGELRLDGAAVRGISSQLRAGAERADAQKLPGQASFAFVGSYVLGMGFVLRPEERARLVERDPRNADRIFPYVGGEDVNTSPTHDGDRYVISFGTMSLEEAEAWPDLIAIVRQKVKPERDKNNRANYRDKWWQFAELRPGAYAAIAPLSRCLVTSAISAHRVFAFVDPRQIFTHNTYVFPLDGYTAFAVMQSRVHTRWAGLLSSGLDTREGYRPSDCFETFPFPEPDPRATIPAVEAAGEALYTARAAFMQAEQLGLTKTYNALKDPAARDPRILELRRLHEAMDRAVLDAYGWKDLDVPPYCASTPVEEAAQAAFADEVVDRLFQLNAERAGKG